MAHILYNNENLFCDPLEACDVYTKQCSIGVTAKQLAVMGATLANGGVNPITKERCLDSKHVPRVLAVMMMAGFYDESGAWAYIRRPAGQNRRRRRHCSRRARPDGDRRFFTAA